MKIHATCLVQKLHSFSCIEKLNHCNRIILLTSKILQNRAFPEERHQKKILLVLIIRKKKAHNCNFVGK